MMKATSLLNKQGVKDKKVRLNIFFIIFVSKINIYIFFDEIVHTFKFHELQQYENKRFQFTLNIEQIKTYYIMHMQSHVHI